MSHGSGSHAQEFWCSHAPPKFWDSYELTRSKSTYFTSPVLHVFHRIIAHMICGHRESTGVVRVRDIFYFSCLVSLTSCNLAYICDLF